MSSRSNVRAPSSRSDTRTALRTLNLRDFVLQYGIEAAREMAASKAERTGVDAAAAMLLNSRNDLAFGCLAFTSLPHKGGGHVVHWEQEREEGTYIWHGGLFDGEPMGVPYGAKARMMLMYLLTEAIRTTSSTVKLGSSMYEWVRAVNDSAVGGMTYKMVSAHSRRIAVSQLKIVRKDDPNRSGASEAQTVMKPRNAPLWGPEGSEAAILNDDFYRECRKYGMPVRLSALRQISNNSAAIDLYLRLSWVLPKLEKPRLLSWSEVAHQFGTGYKHQRHMKPAFVDTLRLVLAVYREAKAELVKGGLLLRPSPPPIFLSPWLMSVWDRSGR